MSGTDTLLDDQTLFHVEALPPVSLADEFGFPPMSVIDRRQGSWQDRKRRWISLGIQSDLGREDDLTYNVNGSDPVSMKLKQEGGGVSVFDPVLAELAYRWWSAPGHVVLDPFAGGSVRGLVASLLGRHYLGIDVRPEQVEANERQAHLGSDIEPTWVVGDARDVSHIAGTAEFDFIFSCPPYASLERYSDDPADLSTLEYQPFVESYRQIIRDSLSVLRPNRFAAFVVGDLRGRDGSYLGLVHDTIDAFRDAGASLYNEAVTVDPAPTAGLRAGAPFRSNRKLTRTHQHLLVFVKGDPKKAAAATKGQAS